MKKITCGGFVLQRACFFVVLRLGTGNCNFPLANLAELIQSRIAFFAKRHVSKSSGLLVEIEPRAVGHFRIQYFSILIERFFFVDIAHRRRCLSG